MCGRKKCSPIPDHPLLCGMVIGFAAIGVCGVVMAAKQQGAKWKKTAAQAGCACMDKVRAVTESAMQSGMQAVDGMLRKMPGQENGKGQNDCGCNAGQNAGSSANGGNGENGGNGQNGGNSRGNGYGRDDRDLTDSFFS